MWQADRGPSERQTQISMFSSNGSWRDVAVVRSTISCCRLFGSTSDQVRNTKGSQGFGWRIECGFHGRRGEPSESGRHFTRRDQGLDRTPSSERSSMWEEKRGSPCCSKKRSWAPQNGPGVCLSRCFVPVWWANLCIWTYLQIFHVKHMAKGILHWFLCGSPSCDGYDVFLLETLTSISVTNGLAAWVAAGRRGARSVVVFSESAGRAVRLLGVFGRSLAGKRAETGPTAASLDVGAIELNSIFCLRSVRLDFHFHRERKNPPVRLELPRTVASPGLRPRQRVVETGRACHETKGRSASTQETKVW